MEWLFGKYDDGVAALGLSNDPPMVAPSGSYQVRVRVVEAKDLSAILNFSLYKSIMSLSWKSQVEAEDKLPNCQTVVRLQRDGFKDQKRKTIVEKETSSPLWNQLFYFEDVEVAEGELEACTIQIQVKDRTSIGRSLTIGTCDLNLAAVYLNDGHEVWNEWLTLTDTKGKREGSQGQVCVCVTVLRSCDEPIVHGDDESDDDAGGFITAAPAADNVEPETWILKAQVYAGRDLPRMDVFGKAGIEAYLRLRCGSSKPQRTRYKRSRSPEWNQELVMRLVVPPGKGGIANMPPLKMSLMDADFGADDHVASRTVALRDLLLHPEDFSRPKWYAFYGGPRGMELAWFTRMSKLAKRMNAGYVEGSAYRGRALLAMTLEKESRRNRGARPKKKIPSVIDKLGQEWPVFLHAEVYSLELNQSRHVGRAAAVEFTVGLAKLASPARALRSEGGAIGKECYAHYNLKLNPMRVKLPTPFDGPLQGEGAPDLFVDVTVGGKRIGYCRVPVKHLMPVKECHAPMKEPDAAETWKVQGWFQLHADAIGGHKRGDSRRAEHVRPVGRVLLRMMLQGSPNAKRDAKTMSPAEVAALENEANAAASGDEEEDEEVDPEKAAGANAEKRADALRRRAEVRAMRAAASEPPAEIDPLPTASYMLTVQVYQAKDLPAADAQGSSDPFAVVRCGRAQAKTHVCHATTSPGWFKEILMQVELPLMPRGRRRGKRGDENKDGDGDADDDEGSSENASEASGSETAGESDVENGGARPSTRRPAGGGRGGQIAGFDGVAWWAAPAVSVVVLDEDVGVLGNDVDPLSVTALPLLHPARRAPRGGAGGNPGEEEEDGFSTLASSASFWTEMGVDDVPDQYEDLANYKVGAPQPEWYPMSQLNPITRGGVELRPGGKILMHYKLAELPREGLFAFAGETPPKKMVRSYAPKIVRSLGDFFGSYPVEVQVMLLGVRGLEPFRGVPITNPRVEIELSGALPLFPGSPFTTQSSQHSSNPNGANANFNGHVLRLRGRVHRLDTIELALSIRIIDALPFKRMVGTAEHKLRLTNDEESDEEEDDDPNKPKKRKRRKLKPITAKPLTAEELRDLETQGMASTASEASLDTDSATDSADEFRDGSETMSVESRDFRGGDGAEYGGRRESFLSKTSSSFKASVHSTGKFIAKTLSKASSKSYREKRRKMKAMEGTLPFDASAEGGGFRKAGSFRGSFKRTVSVEKAGSISRRNSKSGRAESVDVYRKRGGESGRGGESDEDEYSRAATSASGKLTRAMSVLSGGLSAISESERGGGSESVPREGSRHGLASARGLGSGRSRVSDDTDADPDGTELTGDPTEAFSTEDELSASDGDEDGGSNADGSVRSRRGGGDLEDPTGTGSEEDGSDAGGAYDDGAADSEDDAPRFDDGSGSVPEWMVGRSMIVDGTMEDDYLKPLPFVSVPIYRAKGGKDNTSERVVGGKLKFCLRVLPLLETSEPGAGVDGANETLLSTEKEKAKPLIQTKRGKQKRALAEALRRDAAFIADEEGATMPRDQFLALQRLIGGGPSALAPQEVAVRAYVLRGKNLRPLDPSGLCDPYLKVELSGTRKRFGSRKDHVKETLAPWFYKSFAFTTELPGCSQLQFKLLDWDKNDSDDLIGATTIDLEDRWFSAAWNADFAKTPPLELRALTAPGATGNQGNLEVWLEMFEAGDEAPKPIPIASPPIIECELRVIVFKARNVVNKDMGGQNDLFFKVGLVGVDHKQTRFGSTQTTDTHYFATDGKGSFNYRLLYRFTIPVTKAKLRLAAFDRDVIGANDNIGEAVVPLTGLCRDLMRAIDLSPEGELGENAYAEISKKDQSDEGKGFGGKLGSFMDGETVGLWVPLYHPSKNEQMQGEVEVMVQLMPLRKAEQKPVGKGREQPNRDPVLDPPVRVHLNPFDPIGSLAIIMGPDMLRKVLIVGFCLLCLFLGASLAVFIVNDVLAAYINIAISQATASMPGGIAMPSTPSAPHFP